MIDAAMTNLSEEDLTDDGRDWPQEAGAEGATAPETLRPKDRHRLELLERGTPTRVPADGIAISGKPTEGAKAR
ncbi:hypothetical protein NCH01_08340 [Neoasaia chiangmaiensis]|nr:hypothetical protein NCH01_08340 [Neoasaia chiangmaiensis]